MGLKDLAEKILEAENDVFADIVNNVFFGGKQIVLPESLVSADTESTYGLNTLHYQSRDITKRWKNLCNIDIAIFATENQSTLDENMAVRIMGYDAASYKAQIKNNERLPVVTLVIYFGDKKWNCGSSLHEWLKLSENKQIPEQLKPFVSNYKINVLSLCTLKEYWENFTSDFRIIAGYFAPNVEENEKWKNHLMKHPKETVSLLYALTNDSRYGDFLKNNKIEEGSTMTMCQILDRVEAKGRAKGRKDGYERAAKADERAAKAEKELSLVFQNMRNNGLSDSQIANLTGVSIEKVQKNLSETPI